jgi:hypothetical protein
LLIGSILKKKKGLLAQQPSGRYSIDVSTEYSSSSCATPPQVSSKRRVSFCESVQIEEIEPNFKHSFARSTPRPKPVQQSTTIVLSPSMRYHSKFSNGASSSSSSPSSNSRSTESALLNSSLNSSSKTSSSDVLLTDNDNSPASKTLHALHQITSNEVKPHNLLGQLSSPSIKLPNPSSLNNSINNGNSPLLAQMKSGSRLNKNDIASSLNLSATSSSSNINTSSNNNSINSSINGPTTSPSSATMFQFLSNNRMQNFMSQRSSMIQAQMQQQQHKNNNSTTAPSTQVESNTPAAVVVQPTQSQTQSQPQSQPQPQKAQSKLEVASSLEQCAFPSLSQSVSPIETVLNELVKTALYNSCHKYLKDNSVNTVGHLCSLTTNSIYKLPFKTPKIETFQRVMKRFEIASKGSSNGPMGSVEEEMAKLEQSLDTSIECEAFNENNNLIQQQTSIEILKVRFVYFELLFFNLNY